MDNLVITIQNAYLTHKCLKNGIIFDENFDDIVIFKNLTESEVYEYGKKLFGGMRASWKVRKYEEVKAEYEKRFFRVFNNVNYKLVKYLDLKDALKKLKESHPILVVRNDGTEFLMTELPKSIEVKDILNSRFALLETIEMLSHNTPNHPKKKCCKNCNHLGYYDNYLCFQPDVEHIINIDDLETSCDKYEEREGKFWTYPNSPF